MSDNSAPTSVPPSDTPVTLVASDFASGNQALVVDGTTISIPPPLIAARKKQPYNWGLPATPEGWTWGPNSRAQYPNYLTKQEIVLQGPEIEYIPKWAEQYGSQYKRKVTLTYRTVLKKHSACCGIGHATYLSFPETGPEADKVLLMLEAIEIENVRSGRGVSMLTLSKYYPETEAVLIPALEQRGWKVAIPDFENQVWRVGDPNNKVSMWYKDLGQSTAEYRRLLEQQLEHGAHPS